MDLKIVVVFMQLLAACAVSALSCSESELEKCLEPLTKATTGYTTKKIPVWDKEKIEEVCGAYQRYLQCWKPSERDCSERQKLSSKTVTYLYQYLCKDSAEGYLEHRECLSKDSVHKDREYCTRTYNTKIKNINRYMSKSKVKSTLCGYLDAYMDCLGDNVQVACGKKAATWVRGLNEAVLRSTSDFLDCSDNKALIIGIAVAVMVVVVVVFILCIIWIRQRNNRNQSQVTYPVVVQAPVAHSNHAYNVYPPQTPGGD